MKNIILIGMPGSGKSTVGVLLAKALGMMFVDTDLEIMQRVGKHLQEILNEEGLERFLQEEAAAVKALNSTHSVIATGGSVVMEPEAMKHLREMGTIVFLDVSLEELQRRITNIRSRGIAFAPGQQLADVYEERLPLYRQYADVMVEMEKDVEDTVEAVLQKIREGTSLYSSCQAVKKTLE